MYAEKEISSALEMAREQKNFELKFETFSNELVEKIDKGLSGIKDLVSFKIVGKGINDTKLLSALLTIISKYPSLTELELNIAADIFDFFVKNFHKIPFVSFLIINISFKNKVPEFSWFYTKASKLVTVLASNPNINNAKFSMMKDYKRFLHNSDLKEDPSSNASLSLRDILKRNNAYRLVTLILQELVQKKNNITLYDAFTLLENIMLALQHSFQNAEHPKIKETIRYIVRDEKLFDALLMKTRLFFPDLISAIKSSIHEPADKMKLAQIIPISKDEKPLQKEEGTQVAIMCESPFVLFNRNLPLQLIRTTLLFGSEYEQTKLLCSLLKQKINYYFCKELLPFLEEYRQGLQRRSAETDDLCCFVSYQRFNIFVDDVLVTNLVLAERLINKAKNHDYVDRFSQELSLEKICRYIYAYLNSTQEDNLESYGVYSDEVNYHEEVLKVPNLKFVTLSQKFSIRNCYEILLSHFLNTTTSKNLRIILLTLLSELFLYSFGNELSSEDLDDFVHKTLKLSHQECFISPQFLRNLSIHVTNVSRPNNQMMNVLDQISLLYLSFVENAVVEPGFFESVLGYHYDLELKERFYFQNLNNLPWNIRNQILDFFIKKFDNVCHVSLSAVLANLPANLLMTEKIRTLFSKLLLLNFEDNDDKLLFARNIMQVLSKTSFKLLPKYVIYDEAVINHIKNNFISDHQVASTSAFDIFCIYKYIRYVRFDYTTLKKIYGILIEFILFANNDIQESNARYALKLAILTCAYSRQLGRGELCTRQAFQKMMSRFENIKLALDEEEQNIISFIDKEINLALDESRHLHENNPLFEGPQLTRPTP